MIRFKRLSIRNIAAIEEADIDFQGPELSDEEVFLIEGKNGAGKSTILDCISLALFATTARLDGNNEKASSDLAKIDGLQPTDVRGLLRKGTVKGEVVLSFVGKDNHNYTASYTIEKTRNGTFKAGDPWRLVNEDNATELVKKRQIEAAIETDVIGQSFADFMRTVLIPQGQCAEIVKEKADERGRLLAKLVDCSKFEKAGIAIYRKTRSIEEQYQALKLRSGDIVLPSEESMEEKRNQITSLTLANETAAKQLQSLKVIRDAYTEAASIQEKQLALVARQNNAQRQFAVLCGGLMDLKKQYSSSGEELDRLVLEAESEAQDAPMYQSFQSIRASLLSYSTTLQKSQKKRSEASSLASAKEGLESKAGQDDEIVRQHEKAVTELKERIASLDLSLKQTDADSVETKAQAADRKAGALRSLLEDTLPSLSALKQKMNSSSKELEDHRKSMAAATAERENDLLAEKAAKEAMDKAREEYQMKSSFSKSTIDTLRSIIEDKKLEYCPVCGNRIMDTLQYEVVDNMLVELSQKKTDAENAYSEAQAKTASSKASLDTLVSALSIKETTFRKDQELYRKRQDSFSEQCQALGVSAASEDIALAITDAMQAVAGEREALEEVLKSVRQLRSDRDSLSAQLVALMGVLSEAKTAAANSANALSTNITDTQKALEDAEQLASEASHAYASARQLISWKDWDAMWEKDNAVAVQALKEASEKYTGRSERISSLQNSLGPLKRTVGTVEDLKGKVLDLCPEWAEVPESASASPVEGCQEGWISLHGEVSALKSDEAGLMERARKCRAVIAEYEGADAQNSEQTLVQSISELEESSRQNQQNIGSLRTSLEQDLMTREKFEKITLEKQSKEQELKKWNDLNSKFGDATGKKFRDIALCFIFGGIIEKANEILKGIAPRYTLVAVPGTLELRIQDDECGSVLSLNGLSGGESFVASLSIALALASLKDRDGSCDHLFIDEGFGALDGEYLSLVLSTLHKLHQFTGGKKVGIISHVQAMSDSIPVHIEVDKHKVRIRTR